MVSPAVSALREAVHGVLAAEPDLCSAETLLADLDALGEVERLVRAAQQSRLTNAYQRNVTTDECGRSVRSWLIEDQLLNPAEASRRVRLVGELPSHPATQAAYESGEISDGHALVVLSALRQLRDPDHVEPVEAVLLEWCRTHPPFEVAQAVDAILAGLGIESSADAAAARRFSQRNVNVARTFGGTGSLSGTLSATAAEKLQLIFADCAKRIGPEDERDAGARRHDRLEEVLDHYLGTSDELPNVTAERPRVIVTIDLDTLLGHLSERWGILDSGVAIAPATARRLACDAEILPAVLGAPGAVLDIGGLTRSFSTAVKRAALIRDGARCGFPNCRRRLAECHHIVWWAHGGKSTLDNAVWLCAFHHWLAHEGGWSIKRNADGSYTWTNRNGKTITGQPPPRQPQAA